MQEKTKTYTVSEAITKIEHYCAYQERCHKEVIQKLRQMGMTVASIDHIIAHLIKENYLNEGRYARSFARGKFRIKKWGRMRIKRELKMRGITHHNIRLAMQEIEETYFEVFEQLAQAKYDAILEKNPAKARKKLTDYLLYKGWESDLVYEKVTELYPFR